MMVQTQRNIPPTNYFLAKKLLSFNLISGYYQEANVSTLAGDHSR